MVYCWNFFQNVQNNLRIFVVAKNRNFYVHCEKMVDCRYSQVEIVQLKLSFRILEHFANIQVTLISLC